MNYQALTTALTGGQYELSDLGDGTAVLTSLTDSKIVTLNGLGTAVMNTLLSPNNNDPKASLDRLAEEQASQFGVSSTIIAKDIESFLEDLSTQLGAKS